MAGHDYSDFFHKYLLDKDLPVLEYSYSRNDSAVQLQYRWAETGDSFTMPFAVITDTGEILRLDGYTEFGHTTLNGSSTFRFVTHTTPLPDSLPLHTFTYHWTRKVHH
jgi:hypothetical protein